MGFYKTGISRTPIQEVDPSELRVDASQKTRPSKTRNAVRECCADCTGECEGECLLECCGKSR